MTDTFQKFAIYYDMIYGDDVYKEIPGEIDFYLKEARKAKGPVLEVGCGTGRILLPLMSAGIPISGIDISSEMLQILKLKAGFFKGKPQVKKADMTALKSKEKYNLIIIPLNSIHHITNKNQQLQTFKNFFHALKPKGKLIFSSQFYTKEILSLSKYTYVETYARDDWGIEIDLFLKYNKTKKLLQERYEVADISVKKKQKLDLMELYCFDKTEIEELLINAGFQDIMVFKDFKYTPFKKGNDLGLWSATKA
jgi:SAM-dependent methyltransferase